MTDLLPDLITNYRAWESEHLDRNGLFWQIDDRDGMEYSIGGSGYRPTINSYQYGDAVAIAKIAVLAGRDDIAADFREKATRLKKRIQEQLWNKEDQFFETLPRGAARLTGVREEVGFIPWYFHLPDPGFEIAWKQLMDPRGFYAPFGPTTAEQRSPSFRFHANHDCLWNGPSWPYATTQTLVAVANLLNDYKQNVVSKSDYIRLLQSYARSQHKESKPWIAEDLDGRTGKWIVDLPRSVDYNHSAYCDLIITGLAGLRPRADNVVEVNPLIPDGTWNYFALDKIPYHGHTLAIFYDRSGERYRRGIGLHVLADGNEIARAAELQRVSGELSETGGPPSAANVVRTANTSAGWTRYDHNPVLGGAMGTCFDVSLLKEGPLFRMYFSWRPKKSVALTESPDGIHWSDPAIVLGPNSQTDWEQDINRPVVVKNGDGYHMWYTGQARGHSWIGYATSPDGLHWARHPGNPIFQADPQHPWERHKVTACQVVPHGGWFYMFYIGFRDVDHAQIGLARSRDGITGWQRLPDNPIIHPAPGEWDADACYKPFAIYDPDKKRWLLWYNGRRGSIEQIGLAMHAGEELWSSK